MIEIVPKSHTDHLPREVIEQALEGVGAAFCDLAHHQVVIVTQRIPGAQLPCALYGPAMGDAPVEESEVFYQARPGRAWKSRLVDRPVRPYDKVTLVVGPFKGGRAVLYTAYAGPAAPREVNDPRADKDSTAFWAEHALAVEAL